MLNAEVGFGSALVNTTQNIRVPKVVCKFLTSRQPFGS